MIWQYNRHDSSDNRPDNFCWLVQFNNKKLVRGKSLASRLFCLFWQHGFFLVFRFFLSTWICFWCSDFVSYVNVDFNLVFIFCFFCQSGFYLVFRFRFFCQSVFFLVFRFCFFSQPGFFGFQSLLFLWTWIFLVFIFCYFCEPGFFGFQILLL